jgi:hypothetical protein
MMGFGRMAATLQEQLSLDFGYGNMIHRRHLKMSIAFPWIRN